MITIDTSLCVGCGACVADCLSRAIEVVDGHARVIKNCFLCGHCVAVCPTGAVSLEGDGYEMSDVVPFDPATCTVAPDVMLNTIKCRRSIRQFEKRPVSREDMEIILEAGRFTPTGSNAQNVSYIVFNEKTEELRAVAMEEFRKLKGDPEAFAKVFPPPMSPDRVNFDDDDFLFKGAPTIVMTVAPNPANASIAASAPVNAALVSANMELQAVSLGVGMVYIGFFALLAAGNKRLQEYLGLKEDERVVTCMSMGYPTVSYYRSVPRKKAKVDWR